MSPEFRSASEVRLTPITLHKVSKQKKLNEIISKQGSDGRVAVYGTVTELAIANFCLTFGQLVRGDGNKVKIDIRRSLSRGAGARGISTAAAAAPKTWPRFFRAARTTAYGYETKAILETEAISILISRKFCDELNLKAEGHFAG